MKHNNIKPSFKLLLTSTLLASSLYAETDAILLENSWVNIVNSSAKDAMMSGATTATGKGYSSLFTNPAGLSSNYSAGLYFKSSQITHKNDSGSTNEDNALVTTRELAAGDAPTLGVFYKSIILEMQPNVHTALGFAYGLETRYGLFSIGANYVLDDTTPASDPDAFDYYRNYATGDYYTVGLQYQKSFVGIDDFYGVYLGYSQKGQGVNILADQQLSKVSPLVTRMGLGLETNIWATTLLLSYDLSSQSWNHIDATLDTNAIGLKWMLFDGFSIASGISNSTYSTGVNLNEASTVSTGIEFALWSMNVAVAALQKEVTNNSGDVYIEETSAHIDVSFAF